MKRVPALAALGIGTAIRAHAATFPACNTPISSLKICSKSGEWSEKYATQGEILTYAEHVERFGLADGMTFNTRVEATHYLPDQDQWRVELIPASAFKRFVIMGHRLSFQAKLPEHRRTGRGHGTRLSHGQ